MTRWLALAVALAVTLLMAFDRGRTLELPVRDLAMRMLPSQPGTATVVVAIDELSLREVGPWPWPRDVLAEIIDRIADAGAAAVVLDILLTDPRPGDEVLAKAMRRIPTIAVSVLVEREQWLVPAPALRSAATVAHGNFELDHDGILRRFASTKQNRETAYTALSIEAASILGVTPVPVGQSVAPAFRTRPRAVRVESATDILWRRTAVSSLRGRLVFLGPTALGLGDRVLTPVSTPLAPDPGVTVHAAAAEALVRGQRVRELPPIVSGLAAGALVLALGRTRERSRRARLSFAAALLIAVAGGGFVLFLFSGIAVPFAALVISIVLAATLLETSFMNQSMRQSSIRLEEIATRLAEQRAEEVESKRLLAHELKTPLASMRNLTQLLAGFELTESERKRVATLLQAEAGKLQEMVDALLDLERLPLRDFDASSSVTNLGELVNARLDVLRESAGRPITASIAEDVLVRADAVLIERVVDNLVSNAIKYTSPRETIHVTVRQSPDTAVLEVADSGPGIAAADRERVFQRFVRGATAAGTEGLGLGLSLVAEVAKWHRGNVSLESPAEGGALFRFALPKVGVA